MPRLYYKNTINQKLSLNKEQQHYLLRVMRLKSGDTFEIFNEHDGEFSVTVEGKNVILKERIKLPEKPVINIALAFSLIKPSRLSFMIEKCTEIGVTHFFPIISKRSQYGVFNKERYEKIAIEATEQCGRMCPPRFFDLQDAKIFMKRLPEEFDWYVCDKKGESPQKMNASLGVIIGPEGGFAPDELLPNIPMMKLSQHVLRAETAAIVAAYLGAIEALPSADLTKTC